VCAKEPRHEPHASLPFVLTLLLLVAAAAVAQQTSGNPGSPEATTID